jgi:uncharacterized protein (TIGR03067 family)
MRRFVCLLAVVLLALPSLGSDAPKEYDGKTVRDELEGKWRMVAVRAAPDLPLSKVERPRYKTYRDGRWTTSDGNATTATGSYVVIPDKFPAQVNETTQSGRVDWVQCIYRVDGDKLQLATGHDWHVRPDGFDRKDVAVVFYERVK